jgi:hypothetical protein
VGIPLIKFYFSPMHPYRSDNYALFREQLIQYLEFKLGYRIQNISDCHRAANEMLAKRSSISPHTIARIFKIIGPSTVPYKSTLDIISNFCGFRNFDHYVDSYNQSLNGTPINLQFSINSQNAKLETALRLAFQTTDSESIHRIVEQFEDDPFNLWLMNTSNCLYSFESNHRLKLLDILSQSSNGRKYYYEYYVNENDPDGSFSHAIEAFYANRSSDKNAKLFSLLFATIQSIYKGQKVGRSTISKIKELNYADPISELGFHLSSRLKEIQILLQNPRQSKDIFRIADAILEDTKDVILFERTWYFARVLRAFSYLKITSKFLQHKEFRDAIESCYFKQCAEVNYTPLLVIQACLHAFWYRNKIEHSMIFKMHHPLFAQNEVVSIKAMEAFGIALYDASFLGDSIKRNLPQVLKSNGVLWMQGLLPAFEN